ncbi:PH domain-containing protein [Longimicrobium sp.]|jgi:putative membrane protein|uniref:PH domain-containing protein n=1 Tax=Longimicrobium sp. TaxID=2029185 RepID=UPI002ED7C19F
MASDTAALAGSDARRLHPLTFGFASFKIARNMIWPALAGGFSIGGQFGGFVPVFVGVLAVPALIGAALTYARYRWLLTGDELLLRSGVLNRQDRAIPLARVQNVEVRQSLVQRVFGVAELRVETAGAGAEAEAVLSVLSLADAQSVRADLLARRRGVRAVESVEADGIPAVIDQELADAPPLARLSTAYVLAAGATANETGVIAAAMAGLLQFADDLPSPFLDQAVDRIMVEMGGGFAAIAALVLAAMLVFGWLISIVGAVVRYHGFTLWRVGDELRKRYGLLTVHEASIPLKRVQAVRVEESIIRRAFGLASLMIETAGGAPGQRGGAEAFVPIARRDAVGPLVGGIFGGMDLDGVRFEPVHPRAQRRIVLRYLRTLLILWVPFWAARWLQVEPMGSMAPWIALLLPLPWVAARLQYRSRGWALAPGYAVARSGVLRRVTWIVPDAKLQTLHLSASPFQRRLGLSTLVLDTAAGGRAAAVIDLGEETARALLETLSERMAHRPVCAPVQVAEADTPAIVEAGEPAVASRESGE